MRKITNTDIYVWVKYKYQNPIIPRLPEIITTYLLENPNKIDYYFNPNILVADLIKYLANSYSKNQEMDLLEEIKIFMEG